MITIENVEVLGWEHAIRGMRNPMNSWDRSDSCTRGDVWCNEFCNDTFEAEPGYKCGFDTGLRLGPNDHELMTKLVKGGPVHAKYRRMIAVYLDITAPLYWWKEFDTYKVGTVANSCSTMHKIHEKEFVLEDFSCEHLVDELDFERTFKTYLETTIEGLNEARDKYLETNDKFYWWQMIQLLPSSYNQKRTVMLNYEVLAGIYEHRNTHKLDEWRDFCRWIESLPYSEIIIHDELCTKEERDGST